MQDPRDSQYPNRVILHSNRVSGVSGLDCPRTNYGQNDDFDFGQFRKNLQVRIIRIAPDSLQFDLIGVDASIANAFRRIMIAEVPTMAIGTAYILNNTSTIPDEMLVHRIGLLPIKADPSMFDMKSSSQQEDNVLNSLKFRIHGECKHAPNLTPKERATADPRQIYVGAHLLAKQLYWMPLETQLERVEARKLSKYDEMFKSYWQQRALCAEKFSVEPPASVFHGEDRTEFAELKKYWSKFGPQTRFACYPLHENIVVDKLRPGQCVDLQLHVRKGIGRDHAKFSPATSSYRLLPDIIIKEPIYGKDAEKFAECFAEGVVGFKNVVVKGKTVKEAYIKNARNDTVSRECLRHDEFKDKVVLARVRDHFIFNVESLGQYDSPADIFVESIKVLLSKCVTLKSALDNLEQKRSVAR